jgi:hypothetical protein
MRKAIVSAAGPRMEPVLSLAAVTYRSFASVHGYEVVLHTDLDDSRGLRDRRARRIPRWRKIDLLEDALLSFDVVLWLDADAMFCRFDRDVIDDLPRHCFQGFVLEGLPTRSNPNSGVWVLRRRRASIRFLDALRRIGQQDHSWADQAAICVALGFSLGDFHGHGAHWARPTAFSGGTAWLPPDWNTMHAAATTAARVRHFPGMPVPRRVELMSSHLERMRI